MSQWDGGFWRRREEGECGNRVDGQVGPPLTGFGGLLHPPLPLGMKTQPWALAG